MVNVADFFRRYKLCRRHPRRRVTQYSATCKISDGIDYWIPDFTGMTTCACRAFRPREPLLVRAENPVAPGLQSHDIAGLKLVIPRRVDLNQRLALART
jgi:hypothetical protein